MQEAELVLRGREAFARRAWPDAFESLSRADRAAPLRAEELELLATSAYMLGRDDEHVRALERAHHAHLDAGDIPRAVYCAYWIGHNLVGARLVPQLIERGHEVVGSTRSPEKAAWLSAQGAEPVVLDVLDGDAVREALAASRPDAIVHEATALAGVNDVKHFDRGFAATNRLRTEGTDALVAAAREAGVGRFVAQSFAGWPYAREGGPVKSEEDPLDPSPVPAMSETLAAGRHLEQAVVDAEGIVLRYGVLYGSSEDVQLELVRKRRFPIVGDGGGVSSFVHLEDTAAATALALERGAPGIYNVVDDDPAPVREWLPALAAAIGAKPPRRVPRWLARLLAGEAGVVLMTEARGASNAKAKREFGWTPRYPSWRQGFAEAYGAPQAGT